MTGVVAAGVGAGMALERMVVGRAKDGSVEDGVTLGSWRGEPTVVKTEDDVELYVEVDEPSAHAGSGSPSTAYPVTVVFCHAYALNLDEWYFQRRALAADVRMVAYDHRSHGRSGRSEPDTCTLDQLARDLDRVVEEVVPDGPVVLVGHSMGGMTIMALADERPELFRDRIAGVGLVATSPGGLSEAILGLRGPLGRVANRVAPTVVTALTRAPRLVAHGRTAGSDIGYMLTRHYGFGPAVPSARVEFVAEMLAGTPIEVVADFFPTFSNHNRYDVLAAFACVETVILGGAKDLITPVEHSRELARLLPDAEYTELSTCGHLLQIEDPEATNDALRRLLDRATQRGRGTPPPAAEQSGSRGGA